MCVTLFVFVTACSGQKFETDYPVAYNFIVDITQTGLQRYVDQNLDLLARYILFITLPEIPLSIMGFDLTFRNLLVQNVQMPMIEFVFVPGGCNIMMRHMKLDLVFQFQLQQAKYPYLQDKGSGRIRIDINLAAEMAVWPSDTCPGHIKINTSYVNPEVADLVVQMESDLSWLYDMLLYPLTEYLKEAFSSTLGLDLMDSIITMMNDQFDGGWPSSSYDGAVDQQGRRYATDERWAIEVQDVLRAWSPGYLCKDVDSVYRYPERGVTFVERKIPALKLNADVVYSMSRPTFQTTLDFFIQDYYTENLGPKGTFTLTLDKFVNTGALIIADNHLDARAQFLATINTDIIVLSPVTNLTTFGLAIQRAVSCEGSGCGEERVGAFQNDFNDKMQLLKLSYVDANGVSAESCRQVYADEEWFMVGCGVSVFSGQHPPGSP